MGQVNLILNIPHGSVTATSLGLEAYALHRSPGSGKHFRGKTVMVDLGLDGDRPAFRFLEEGGWRDPGGDAVAALAAIILSGQPLAVFMANSGGAWDNAKKLIEDGHYGGRGSAQHKAAVVGDTVGDPLKETAGPALNPMIKVINLVSVLSAPLIVQYKRLTPGLVIAVVAAFLAVAAAVWYSKRPGIGPRRA